MCTMTCAEGLEDVKCMLKLCCDTPLTVPIQHALVSKMLNTLLNHPKEVPDTLAMGIVGTICHPVLREIMQQFLCCHSGRALTSAFISDCILIHRLCLPMCKGMADTSGTIRGILSSMNTWLDGNEHNEDVGCVLQTFHHTGSFLCCLVKSLTDESFEELAVSLYEVLVRITTHTAVLLQDFGLQSVAPALLFRRVFFDAYFDSLLGALFSLHMDDVIRSLAVVCSVADHLFGEWLSEDRMLPVWRLIRQGLTDGDQLTRKRSRYLVQRAVECRRGGASDVSSEFMPWSAAAGSGLVRKWNDLVLILETLEEKQVHIIKPVLEKVDVVLESGSPVPYSISLCILVRALSHGNTSVVRWGVLRAMDLPASDELERFVCDSLLPALNNSSLYSDISAVAGHGCFDDHDVCKTRPTECGRKLDAFLTRYFSGEDIKSRVGSFLRSLTDMSWSPVALLHVTHVFWFLDLEPCLDGPLVSEVCSFVTDKLGAQELYLRDCSKSFMLNALLLRWVPRSPVLRTLMDIARLVDSCMHIKALSIGDFSSKTFNNCLSTAGSKEFLTGEMIEVFKDTSSHPERRRFLGTAVIFLSNTQLVPLSVDHPVVKLVCSSLTRCHEDLYRPTSAVVADIAVLTPILCAESLKSPEKFREVFQPIVDSVFDFIIRRCSSLDSSALEYVQYYSRFIEAVANLFSRCGTKRSSVFEVFLSLLTSKVGYSVASTVLTTALFSNLFKITIDDSLVVMEPLSMTYLWSLVSRGLRVDKISLDAVGKVLIPGNTLLSKHTESVWWLTQWLLTNDHCPDLLELPLDPPLAINAVNVASRRSLGSIIKSVGLYLRRTKTVATTELVHACWSAMFEHRKSEAFSECLQAFCELVFTPLHLSSSDMVDTLKDVVSNLIELSHTVEIALFFLIKAINLAWEMSVSMVSDICEENWRLYARAVVTAVQHGPVRRRDCKTLAYTVGYLRRSFYAHVCCLVPRVQDGRGCHRCWDEPTRFCDCVWRVCASDSVELKHRCQAHAHVNVTSTTIRAEGIVGLARLCRSEDALTSAVTELERALFADPPRHYANSTTHRLQQRAYQALLVVFPKLSEEVKEGLLTKCLECLLTQHLQPSVRYLVEWLSALLCLHSGSWTCHVWHYLEQAGKRRAGSVGSFVAILYQLVLQDSSGDCSSTEEFVLRCFADILPWAMAQHFNVRIYSQVALVRFWDVAERADMTRVTSQYRAVVKSIGKALAKGNAAKHSHVIQKDFYFTSFDAVKCYSLDTIFMEIPRLASVDPDEWTTLELARQMHLRLLPELGDCGLPDSRRLRLKECDSLLTAAESARWTPERPDQRLAADDVTDRSGGGGDVTDRNGGDGDVTERSGGSSTAVQRKTTPWRQLLPSELTFDADSLHGQLRSGPVLVASLVDRAPNLGGLCRTCEVFGARQLVISSLSVVDDTQFKNLSVSAEKWVPIVEVGRRGLCEYLAQMRRAGHQLVGLEQTSGSVSVAQCQLRRRCVLLLGNEKEGIPVELLHMLDVLVEIPQCGVVRSLNVHVVGALMLWEYRKQHPAEGS